MIKNECTVYHPIGAGSNVYKTCFLDYIKSQLPKNKVRISVGAQPNSIPHFGTLIVFSLAFCLAKSLREQYPGMDCEILFEMVDTAPAEVKIFNDIEYQLSLKCEGLKYLSIFQQLLEQLKEYHKVDFKIRGQSEFNNSCHAKEIIHDVISNHEKTDVFLAPDTHNLRIRIACPKCGLSDKKARMLRINGDYLESYCPIHGEFSVNFCYSPCSLEYNTPLRNLIRQLIYMRESEDPEIKHCWLRITGSDYAGFYQEQTLYKAASVLGYDISKLPVIVYAPLVTDWSGAKLSKSLYVSKNAYSDLPKYLLN